MRTLLPLLGIAQIATAACALAQAQLRTFTTQQLSDVFFCEGATFGDLNRDGVADVIAGPHWYEGPAFTARHDLYTGKPFDTAGYSDNFFAFVHDFDADGWNDVLVIGFPGQKATWYENPRDAGKQWLPHVVFDGVDNESPTFVDLTGDGKPELVCQHDDRLGYALVDWTRPAAPWQWHPASATGLGGRFTHGLGVGDVNGDGRADLLWKHGWWEQPASLANDPQWQHHAVKFCNAGGAQILVFDVDGDGDNDVVSSDNAHGYGLLWFEQRGKDEWRPHPIMGSRAEDNPYGLVIGNLHALCTADVDADGLPDVITGNRFFAHGGRDRADGEKPKLVWFRLRRTDGLVTWVPNEIHGDSGVGTQVVAGDMDGDGHVDVVVGNKKGTFVHRQVVKNVSWRQHDDAERAALARIVQGGHHRRTGTPPRAADGRVLNLDFETGDLRDWTATGDAFPGVNDGDTVLARRGDMRSGHSGRYWVGSYEAKKSDQPRGTLTSAPFVLHHAFASFLIGGGASKGTRVELVLADTGEVVHTAYGRNDEFMEPVQVDLTQHAGNSLLVRLVDDSSGGWGHVNFDDFRLHDRFERDGGFAPDEAIARMTVPAGFKVKAFAAEPDVRQPIAMCVDDKGRVWIAEGHTYPQRAPDGEGRDRIVVFTDRDGDGRFDERKVFAENLNLVSGIEVGFGGLFVGASPWLLFLADANDDLVPDGEPRILLDGWHWEDTHETLNAFTWGPDGWLYGCHGVFTHSRVGKPGTPDDQRQPLNAAVWRFHPKSEAFEVFAHGASNQWGVDFDDRGQAFITACVIPHLYHVIQGGLYRRQSGRHFNPFAYGDIPTIADHLHYVGPDPHDGNRISDAVGGGHAHCGALLYRGGRWPQQYHGALLMDNIHGHRINMDVLSRRGSGFTGSHGPDFLRSNDEWFMAVSLRHAHDGNVYLIDWYDDQSCHVRDPEVWDRSNGRIYKVCYGDDVVPPVDLRARTNAELVPLLFDQNEFVARHARRLLQERNAIDTAPALHAVLADAAADEPKRLRALWAAHVVGALDDARLTALLGDRHEYVRAFAIQLAVEDRSATPEQVAAFAAMAANDVSSAVRLYLASALQRLPHAQRWRIAEALSRHPEDASDHNLPLMVWYGIEPALPEDPARAIAFARGSALPRHFEFVVRRLVEAGGGSLDAVVRELANAKTPAEALAILTPAQRALERHADAAMPKSWPDAWANVTKLRDRKARDLAVWLGAMFGDAQALPELGAVVADTKTPRDRRSRAFDLLARGKGDAVCKLIRSLLDDEQLGERAIRALASFDDATVPALLLGKWSAFAPASQRAAVTTLCSRAVWAMALLDGVATGALPRVCLDAPARQQLTQLGDAAVGKRLTEVWGRSAAAAAGTREQIDLWKKKLTGAKLAAADLHNGRAVYARTCMACHQLFGSGFALGPDLTGSNRKDLDYILANIIEPSSEVARDYMMANVRLKSGGTVMGMLADETATAVTVRTQLSSQVVGKDDIAKIEHLEVSLMPPGQLDGLSDDDVRDLIAYLAADEQVPMRATKYTAQLFFDGSSLAMWIANPQVWSVEDGELVGRTATGIAHNDFCKSELMLSDFELSFEVKLASDAGNSGVQFRSEVIDGGDVRGLQADIGPGWWGKLYEEHGRGLLESKGGEQHVVKGDWNRYRIVCKGSRVQTWINDQLCVDRDDPAAATRGITALQVHSGGPTEVRFRAFQLTVK